MSTLMSKDLHINRSSTRLHAPPGGKSNLSLSDGTSSFNQFDRSPLPAKNNYSSYQTTNSTTGNLNAYPTSYVPTTNNRSIPSSSSSSSTNTVMDPKLQQYMQTLSPEEKKIFESLVNEEMDKLSSDFKSSSIDSNPSSNYNDYAQKQTKQQNQAGGVSSGNYSSNYSDSHDNSIMNVGTRKPPSGSGGNNGGGRISSFSSGSGSASSDEYTKKRLAQESYSNQLAQDTNSKTSNNNNDNSRFGNRPSASRELQQRLVESNYVSPRTDLFSGLTGSNDKKMSQQEYAQALQQDQYRNSTIEPSRRTPLTKTNSQSGGYDNNNNAYSNNYSSNGGGGNGYGGSSGGGASSGMAGMLSPTGNIGGGKPSAGFADTANQRDKQQKYAYELAVDVQRKKEIQQDKERKQYTPNAKNNSNNSNNNNNYPPVANTNNYNSHSTQYNGSGSSFNYGGGGDERVKEYSAFNIPGLAPSAPNGGGGRGANDMDYASHPPIYTSKAKAGGGNMPMADSIDYHVNSSYDNNRGGGGGGSSSNSNPIHSVSVGRGRSSGGGQSTIQLF